MALVERDQFDPEDATDDASEEDFEEQDESEDDGSEDEQVELADRSSGKGKSAQDDEEDEPAPDDEADEGEALDDSMDSEDYAEEDEEDEPPMPKGKRGGTKKMSESVALAENVKLRERVAQLEGEKLLSDIRSHFSTFNKTVKLDDVEPEEQVAVSRAFRIKYQKFAEKLIGDAVKLGESEKASALLSELKDLTALAFSNKSVVPLVSLANNADKADLDDRRPQPQKRTKPGEPPDMTPVMANIALSELKKPVDEMSYDELLKVYALANERTNHKRSRSE